MMPEDESPLLGPGVHARADGRFSYAFGGNQVHVEPTTVGDPFAAGLRTWQDPMLGDLLGGIAEGIAPDVHELLPWALTTVSAYSPGSLGLFAPAGYSGPRATGLVGNLKHRTRADAFAAELIVAACLACQTWHADDGWTLGGLRHAGGRIDFGVKLLAETTGRRTVEADILLTDASGHRHAVDVKYSRASYRSAPTEPVLAIIEQAIWRREIDTFTFTTPTRFRPVVRRTITGHAGVHLLEGVWPSNDDVVRLRMRERQAVDYGSLIREHRHLQDPSRLFELTVDAISYAYLDSWGPSRQLVTIEAADGFTYLFDATTDATRDEPAPRVVAGWGYSHAPDRPRDAGRLRRFPLPPSPSSIDRGHLIARSAGSRDDLGLNLIPQDTAVNRGRGPFGRRWRQLERHAATTPGTPLLVRALYDDISDHPAQLEYLVADPDHIRFDRFPNRPGIV